MPKKDSRKTELQRLLAEHRRDQRAERRNTVGPTVSAANRRERKALKDPVELERLRLKEQHRKPRDRERITGWSRDENFTLQPQVSADEFLEVEPPNQAEQEMLVQIHWLISRCMEQVCAGKMPRDLARFLYRTCKTEGLLPLPHGNGWAHWLSAAILELSTDSPALRDSMLDSLTQQDVKVRTCVKD